MTIYKTFGKLGAALVLGAAMVIPALTQAQTLELRISGENPMTGLDLQMAERFAQNLQTALGDGFAFEFFHTQALGDETVHMQMIRTGQIDVYPMGSDAVSLDRSWAIFDMPFLFSDRETVARLLDGEVGEMLRASMRESAGLEVLAFGELGFRNITNNVRPIVVPSDLEGVRLRVPGSQARILAFTAFGAQPISMNMGELYLGLQQGTVDGQENPLITIRNRSFFEVQDYMSLSRHVYSPVTLVMNGARFDSLTDEQRAAVIAAAQEAAEYTRGLGAQADASLLEELGQSMEINEIDIEAFRAASVPIWEAVGDMAGSEFAAQVVAAASN
ncbi:TRAP transporter substrate-binding protein [Roseicyclus mahoneyensis]|uniref:Tripartite ATP-independent transporter DctP family solute receptor n=1 Tax=Roseicyclus mahoneyensis TaxID=164332 RepID=A0A316GL57_9RHOB|nr:TRAP transporter substrate-binding protein [Roseicyclus mahoneyensis]PWK61356.1 tripartite ATP-independent transporter DctP family solute receptor [Roseicyclus mahoneyensis]